MARWTRARPAVPVRPDQSPIRAHDPATRVIAVLVEPGRPEVAGELLGAAAQLGRAAGATVHALSPGEGTAASLGAAGADLVVVLDGSPVAEDVADAVADYVRAVAPWALLAPSTAFGREVAGPRRGRDGLGARGRRHRALRTGRRTRGGQARFCRRAGGRHHVHQRHPDGHGPARRAAGAGARAPRGSCGNAPRRTRGRVRVLAERRDDDIETLARARW